MSAGARTVVLGGLAGVVVLGAVGFLVWLRTLPPARAASSPTPIPEEEAKATLAALAPTTRPRPLIAIIGINDATETTDYLMTYGILRRANVADVVALSTEPGPVKLFPVLTVQAQSTAAEFDAQHPGGADYVIVPAMSRDDDPVVMEWLKRQAARGATIIGVCAGAKVVAEAGLLDGKRATTHWYYLDKMLERHPTIDYVADRRLVVDGRVATTTGISASMPIALTLIEAIAGRAKAEEVARDLGLAAWDARHDSGAFKFNRPFATTVLGNTLAFWRRERFGIPLEPGVDEVSLALVADAWSRTYRSRAETFANNPDGVATRSGLRVIPDRVASAWPDANVIPSFEHRPPVQALDAALEAIADRYGAPTASVVAMQLEYPWKSPPASS